MIYRYLLIIFFCLTATLSAISQSKWYVLKNIQSEWLINEGEEYLPYDNALENTIYFSLDAAEHKGSYLTISSRQAWTLFINGKLRGSYLPATKDFSLDSLRQVAGASKLFIAVHKNGINAKNLTTQIRTKNKPAPSTDALTKPDSSFRDFVMIATLLLLVLLIIINQMTKLGLGYLSFKRLFSLAEGDEAPRIARGSNVLFCFFCSLILALYFIIIFRFTGDRFDIAWAFRSDSFWLAFWQWIKLSLILFFALVAKVILVFAMSRLFGFRELFNFQIFNWIKILMVTFGILTVIMVVYFISHGSNPGFYVVLFWTIVLALAVWAVTLLMKVARRAEYSLFHIFSYLCATEIIPLLISIKLMYY